MSSQKRSPASDDINSAKWDGCLTRSIITTAMGFTWGIVFSALLFKRRPWPIFLGTGMGIGMSYSNCQNDLRSSYVPSRSVLAPQPTTSSESP